MQSKKQTYLAPALLFLLGSISVAFGILQLSLMAHSYAVPQEAAAAGHYLAMPVPIVIHIIAGSLFNLLLPLQYIAPLRLARRGVHRYLGRLLVVCGVAFAVSALWMNQFYPQYGGVAKYLGILAHCGLTLFAFTTAIIAIRNKQVDRHRIWMMRATAAALSPATQRLFIIPAVAVFGEGILSDALIGGLIWFGLLLNLAVVEWCWRGQRRAVMLHPANA